MFRCSRATVEVFFKTCSECTRFYSCEGRANTLKRKREAQFRRGQASQQCGLPLDCFAFVSIQTCLYKVEITLAGQTDGPSPFIVFMLLSWKRRRYIDVWYNPPTPHVHRLSVKLQTDWTQSNRDNDGQRLHTSEWWSLMTCHLPAWFNKTCPHWLVTFCPEQDLGWSS